MGHDSYAEENSIEFKEGDATTLWDEEKREQSSSKPQDYSRIIEELQSHRKEIEKLQIDMTGCSLANTANPTVTNNTYKSRVIVGNEFFPFCPLEELQQQLGEIIDEDGEGKEEYITAEDFNTADQGFDLISVSLSFLLVLLVLLLVDQEYIFTCDVHSDCPVCTNSHILFFDYSF